MAINNQSFLESWIRFNSKHYAFIVNSLMQQYPERNEDGSRFVAIEIFKILHEIVETIGMWYYSLKATAFKPEMKLHEVYNLYQASPNHFGLFTKELTEQDENSMLKTLGISHKVRPRSINDNTFKLLIRQIRDILIRSFTFKFLDNITLTKMYYKCKHGGSFYIDANTKSYSVGILVYEKENTVYDNPHFDATLDFVELLKNAVTKECTPVLQNLIVLRYENDKIGNHLIKPYISY